MSVMSRKDEGRFMSFMISCQKIGVLRYEEIFPGQKFERNGKLGRLN